MVLFHVFITEVGVARSAHLKSGRNKKRKGSFLLCPKFFNLTEVTQPHSTPTTPKGKLDKFTSICGTDPRAWPALC